MIEVLKMLIDISLLKENEVLNVSYSDFKGNITLFDGIYTLFLDVSLKVDFECDRCLSPVSLDTSFSLEDKFSKDIAEDDVKAEIFKISKHIDLNERIRLGLLSNKPSRILCSENCKGLCPKCGQNFNHATCECDNTNYDERFDKLRSLYIKDNETEVQ